MAKVRTYTRDLKWYADLPGKPGDGSLASIQQNARRSLGALINNGWSFRPPKIEPTAKTGRYELTLTIKKQGQRRFEADAADAKAIQIQDKLSLQLPGWRKIVDGSIDGSEETQEELTTTDLLAFPENVYDYFSHIYERDLHIHEMMDAIALARDTDMRMREHILFHGYPGCAKSELTLVIPKIFGDVAVKKLDATSLTKAGAERMLLESPQVPRVVILEEIEKTNEANLPWLLAVLDVRGELIKTTARMDVSRLTRCLVIATANDVERLKTYQGGALYDRFAHRLYCPLPSRDLLRKILEREIANIPNGNPAWIEPALDYALNEEKTYQVRRVLAIMALGKDRLLDGSYQESHRKLRALRDSDLKTITQYNVRD